MWACNLVNLLSTVSEAFFSQWSDVSFITDENCANLSVFADFLSQSVAFADEFQSNVHELAVSLFCEYPYVLVVAQVSLYFYLLFFDSTKLT